jgi:hypothetical protein
MSASAATDYGVRVKEPVECAGTVKDTPKWLNGLLDELTALSRLPANWDSYEARAIDPQAALMTARFLWLVLREDAVLPKLVPTVGGNIQLEWYNDRAELEIEVGARGPLTACFVDHRSREEWETEITADLATVADKINSCF